MNTNRIASLLHYDWMLHKHTLKLTGIVIGIIYLCLALLYFVIKYELGAGDGNEHLPTFIGFFCQSFFSYAALAAMLVTTTILTEKFCYPRTATAYLTLPGTSFEKFVVMMAEYGITWIAMQIYFIIMFYITMGVCALNAPSLDWMLNVFSFYNPTEFADAINEVMGSINSSRETIDAMDAEGGAKSLIAGSIQNLLTASIWMNPFSSIAYLAYYLVLNMFFKSNVQIKAIACMFLTYFVFIVGIMILIFGWLGMNAAHGSVQEEHMLGQMSTFLDCITVFIYSTPAIAAGLLYWFYGLIARKQAK